MGYTVDGKRTDEMPMTQSDIARAVPVYESCPGGGRTSPAPGSSATCRPKPAITCCGWKSLPEPLFRVSASARAGTRRSCDATFWPRGEPYERIREEPVTMPRDPTILTGLRPARRVPRLEPVEEPPGFGRFVEAMRRAQDLAVSCDGADWNAAADRVEDLVAFLAPHRGPGGIGPASRVMNLPGAGSLLMAPWRSAGSTPTGSRWSGVQPVSRRRQQRRPRRHGGHDVRRDVRDDHPRDGPADQPDGVPARRLPQGDPDRRAAYRARLGGPGRGRKTFVNATLTDAEGRLLAEANG